MKTQMIVMLENSVACEVLKFADARDLTLDDAIQIILLDGLDFGKTLPPPKQKKLRKKVAS
jgi:hypothetical protein